MESPSEFFPGNRFALAAVASIQIVCRSSTLACRSARGRMMHLGRCAAVHTYMYMCVYLSIYLSIYYTHPSSNPTSFLQSFSCQVSQLAWSEGGPATLDKLAVCCSAAQEVNRHPCVFWVMGEPASAQNGHRSGIEAATSRFSIAQVII